MTFLADLTVDTSAVTQIDHQLRELRAQGTQIAAAEFAKLVTQAFPNTATIQLVQKWSDDDEAYYEIDALLDAAGVEFVGPDTNSEPLYELTEQWQKLGPERFDGYRDIEVGGIAYAVIDDVL